MLEILHRVSSLKLSYSFSEVDRSCFICRQLLYCGGGGQEGGNPGVMGAGGLRKAGEEGAGGGISKRGGSQEKWEKFRNTGTKFRNRKSTRKREPLWKGVGSASAGCGRRDVQTPRPPPPPHHINSSLLYCLGEHFQARMKFY